MKTFVKYFLIVMVVPLLFITGCKDTTEEVTPTSEFSILSEYLESQGMDLDHVIKSANGNKFVMAPSEAADVSGRYIIDIRSADDYASGHIEGAINTPFSAILDEAANAGNKQILVVCYTGQTACYATALLRLYGYTEAQALKWGMSGWNSTTDSWSPKIGSPANGHANWNNDPAVTATEKVDPSLETGATSGDAILKSRVEAVVAAGFKKVTGADILTNPENYYVNNYFSEAHFTGFGHVKGAYRIKPLLLGDNSIKNLDSSKPVVTYCYTGQTSAVISAFLNVLGYDARSLVFGMNGLNHNSEFWTSGEVANHWGVNATSKDFPIIQ